MPNKTAMQPLWTNVMAQAPDFYVAQYRKCLKPKNARKAYNVCYANGVSLIYKNQIENNSKI